MIRIHFSSPNQPLAHVHHLFLCFPIRITACSLEANSSHAASSCWNRTHNETFLAAAHAKRRSIQCCGCTSPPAGYSQSVCNAGYYDWTQGSRAYWGCGSGCPGGAYWTDGGCNCACVPVSTCVGKAAHMCDSIHWNMLSLHGWQLFTGRWRDLVLS